MPLRGRGLFRAIPARTRGPNRPIYSPYTNNRGFTKMFKTWYCKPIPMRKYFSLKLFHHDPHFPAPFFSLNNLCCLTEEIVTRYCYNTTSLTQSWHPAGCAEYNMMDTCYCNKEGCNSQEALRTTSGVLLFTTILAKVFIFRFWI